MTAETELRRLLDVMARLRAPDGCPWDQAQDFTTIAPYTIEEAYEVADAIMREDWTALPDELGDLLFQVVYYAQMADEAGRFDFAAIAGGIADKMIRRHPHVFAGGTVQPGFWEAQKSVERAARREAGVLAGVPVNLPALTRASKLTSRAARVGFDWPDAEAVLDKLAEETAELRAELAGADAARLKDEVGDMLFVLANLARKLGLDAETCLAHANAKFSRRFEGVEAVLASEGLSPGDAGLERMEAAWAAVKRAEWKLRRATPADAASVRELTLAAYAKWVPVLGRTPKPMTADYDAAVRDHVVDMLELDGELAALIEMRPEPGHLLIVNVAVAPAQQGRGYGRALLAHAEEFARSLRLRELRLYTGAQLTGNVKLYERLGYTVDRVEESPDMNGVFVHMSKALV